MRHRCQQRKEENQLRGENLERERQLEKKEQQSLEEKRGRNSYIPQSLRGRFSKTDSYANPLIFYFWNMAKIRKSKTDTRMYMDIPKLIKDKELEVDKNRKIRKKWIW